MFGFCDPHISTGRADDYVNQLKAFGDEMELHGDVRELVDDGMCRVVRTGGERR